MELHQRDQSVRAGVDDAEGVVEAPRGEVDVQPLQQHAQLRRADVPVRLPVQRLDLVKQLQESALTNDKKYENGIQKEKNENVDLHLILFTRGRVPQLVQKLLS